MITKQAQINTASDDDFEEIMRAIEKGSEESEEPIDFRDEDLPGLLDEVLGDSDSDIYVADTDGDGDDDTIVFVADGIPGAPDAEDITIDEEPEEKPENSFDELFQKDPWNWQTMGHGSFINWLQRMLGSVPRHSGYDTTGLEKAISYFEAIDREISKAMRTDFKDEIDSANAEKAREQIEEGLERLVDRLDQVKTTKYKRHGKKKKASFDSEMVKHAQRMPNVSDIIITVPLLISRIARVIINGSVSAGHDIEEMFDKQATEYNLNKREKAELEQLILDMGYPIFKDRGYPPGEGIDKTRSDNFDWAANYMSAT